MSAPASLLGGAVPTNLGERAHRLRMWSVSIAAALIFVALAVYGWDYYLLPPMERPFSPKHELLKPSGSLGIKLGVLGLALFLTIFLYPLRKRIKWLGRLGSTKHWLDFHIVVGLTAPVLVAFHASFKFKGIAGVAFWIMMSVVLSGVVGRYIYAQIPRSLSSAELSMKELASLEEQMTAELSAQHLFTAEHLQPVLRIPVEPAEVSTLPVYRMLWLMIMCDVSRPFQVARLRMRFLGWRRALLYAGGLLRTGNADLERIVRIARSKSSLSKRLVFLSRSQQVFHLWHVVHRPFSYSFAVLAILHIVVVISLGFL